MDWSVGWNVGPPTVSPRPPQDLPKAPQDAPMTPPRRRQHGPGRTQDAPRHPQDAPNPDWLQEPPRPPPDLDFGTSWGRFWKVLGSILGGFEVDFFSDLILIEGRFGILLSADEFINR